MQISPRRALVALVSAACVSAAVLGGGVASVQAADGGLFEALFGVSRAPQAQPQAEAPSATPGVERPRNRRVARKVLRTRYAALPVKIRVAEKPKPVDMTGGPVAALMRDETLRPGDIVVLKTGARVFTGNPDGHHTLRDFEPVQNSTLVDRKTRQMLAGMVAPMGALPADEARRVLARMRSAPRPAATPVVEQAGMRVINPWISAP